MNAGRAVLSLAAGCAALLVSAGAVTAAAAGIATGPNCAAPRALAAIGPPLVRSAARIFGREALTILAMGSSSTRGTGATSPAMSYPSRLEVELTQRFPEVAIRVVNHGIGGQEVRQELERLQRDIVAVAPDLVIWQLGTNAVLRHEDVSGDRVLIGRGIALLKGHGIDVVLMDMQYAPRVLVRPAAAAMERLIAEIAEEAQIGLFRRFAIMRGWTLANEIAPAALIGADGLHMTDASYGCLATELADSLAANWASTVKLAKSPHRRPAAIAGLVSGRLPGAVGAALVESGP